jgi:hypothetical protein
MRRFLWLVPLILMLMIPTTSCTMDHAQAENRPNVSPRRVSVELLVPQSYDSLGAVITWVAPPPGGLRRFPLASYDVWIENTDGSNLAQSSVVPTTLSDTLWTPMPPLGDTLWFQAFVASVDTSGMRSEATSSNIIVWITTPLAPLAPSTVNVDTTIGMRLVIDSLRVLARGGPPYEMEVNDTLRFAAVLYSGDYPVECCCQLITDPIGTHPCDDVELVNLGSIFPGLTVPYRRSDRFTTIGASWSIPMKPSGEFLHPQHQLQRRWLSSILGKRSPVSARLYGT